jgi:hypothetical protein
MSPGVQQTFYLQTLLGYRHISARTALDCMKILKGRPAIGTSSVAVIDDEEEVEEVIVLD